jgi:hypothetical protein
LIFLSRNFRYRLRDDFCKCVACAWTALTTSDYAEVKAKGVGLGERADAKYGCDVI